jgi:protein TonB
VLATLIETKRPVRWSGAFGGGAFSLVVHSTIIAAAVYATLRPRTVETVSRPIVTVEMPRQSEPPPPPAPVAQVVGPQISFSTLAIPTDIPSQIPPPSRLAFDPARFSGLGVESANPWRADTASAPAVRTAVIYSTDMLEEPPVRVGGPLPVYPDLLRRAGIGGQVVLEFVVDSLGAVVPNSVRIVRSTHPAFEKPARDAVRAWRFRPGRLDGEAVNALVRVPLNFIA